MSDQGFIGETEAHLQAVLSEFSARGSSRNLAPGMSCEERIYV
jgi:hypothetical protein